MHYDMTFAKEEKLRIITIDRPGHGESDFNPTGTILTVAQDVRELISQLNIPQFSVAGMSAGAPFALGLSAFFPEKIVKSAIISGFAPLTKESTNFLTKEVKTLLTLAKKTPFLLRILLKIQTKQLSKNPKKAIKNFLKIMSKEDQEILKNPQVMEVIESMFVEAFRKGSSGVAHEISSILVKDWGFQLSEIAVPTHFWQGKKDNNVPYQWAQWMSNECPTSQLTLFEEEGHLIIFNHAKEIFSHLKPD